MTGEGHKDWLSDCDFHPGYDNKVLTFFIQERRIPREFLLDFDVRTNKGK